MMYAALEGHLLADLFRKRFAMPMGGFLRRYVALRQKEGVFRECDPDVALMFAMGTMVHYAMGQYVFRMERFRLNDDAVMDELVDLVMRGLRRQEKDNHAK